MTAPHTGLDIRTWLMLIAGLIGLALVYVFQRFNYGMMLLGIMGIEGGENLIFILNKTLRLLMNDTIGCLMIFAVFKERRERQVAMVIFLLELLVILPAYLIIKLKWEGTGEISSPLLSFIHRLVVNPTLMVMTGIALAYQKFVYPNLHK
jgi:exosortase F-associated protein